MLYAVLVTVRQKIKYGTPNLPKLPICDIFEWFEFAFEWFKFAFEWFEFAFKWFEFAFKWFEFVFEFYYGSNLYYKWHTQGPSVIPRPC